MKIENIRITLNDMAEEGNRMFLRLIDLSEWDKLKSKIEDETDQEIIKQSVVDFIEGE